MAFCVDFIPPSAVQPRSTSEHRPVIRCCLETAKSRRMFLLNLKMSIHIPKSSWLNDNYHQLSSTISFIWYIYLYAMCHLCPFLADLDIPLRCWDVPRRKSEYGGMHPAPAFPRSTYPDHPSKINEKWTKKTTKTKELPHSCRHADIEILN